MRIRLFALALPAVLALAAFGTRAPAQDPAAPPPLWSSSTESLIGHLQERARLIPWDATAYLKLGQAYLERARETADPTYYTKAEGVLQRALELGPEEATTMAALGNLALAKHQFQEALAWGEEARTANPDLAAAYGVIGDALVESGRYPEAFQALQQMVDRRPDLSSYARVSYARELTGDADGAIAAMRRAADAGGLAGEAVAWARTQLGELYRFYHHDYAAAERGYAGALAARPGYPPALAGLARLAAARAVPHEAIDLARRAFDALPSLEHGVLLSDLLRTAGQETDARSQDEVVQAIRALNEASGVAPEPEPRTPRLRALWR